MFTSSNLVRRAGDQSPEVTGEAGNLEEAQEGGHQGRPTHSS